MWMKFLFKYSKCIRKIHALKWHKIHAKHIYSVGNIEYRMFYFNNEFPRNSDELKNKKCIRNHIKVFFFILICAHLFIHLLKSLIFEILSYYIF